MPVRVDDINYGGHLGNDAVLSLLQEARLRLLATHGFSEMDVDGVGMIMVDAAVEYKAEAFYGEMLRIEVGVNEFTSTGCDFVYRITKADGKEVARAKTGIAFFDYTRRKIVSVPEKFRALMVSGREDA